MQSKLENFQAAVNSAGGQDSREHHYYVSTSWNGGTAQWRANDAVDAEALKESLLAHAPTCTSLDELVERIGRAPESR